MKARDYHESYICHKLNSFYFKVFAVLKNVVQSVKLFPRRFWGNIFHSCASSTMKETVAFLSR